MFFDPIGQKAKEMSFFEVNFPDPVDYLTRTAENFPTRRPNIILSLPSERGSLEKSLWFALIMVCPSVCHLIFYPYQRS